MGDIYCTLLNSSKAIAWVFCVQVWTSQFKKDVGKLESRGEQQRLGTGVQKFWGRFGLTYMGFSKQTGLAWACTEHTFALWWGGRMQAALAELRRLGVFSHVSSMSCWLPGLPETPECSQMGRPPLIGCQTWGSSPLPPPLLCQAQESVICSQAGMCLCICIPAGQSSRRRGALHTWHRVHARTQLPAFAPLSPG